MLSAAKYLFGLETCASCCSRQESLAEKNTPGDGVAFM
jgi:hypothetical protein